MYDFEALIKLLCDELRGYITSYIYFVPEIYIWRYRLEI
jgi:hypothetical protein